MASETVDEVFAGLAASDEGAGVVVLVRFSDGTQKIAITRSSGLTHIKLPDVLSTVLKQLAIHKKWGAKLKEWGGNNDEAETT